MPWKECSVMDERLQFVARRLNGEPMAELCREFGISRKTGYGGLRDANPLSSGKPRSHALARSRCIGRR
jgi:hypothetical protein